MDPRDSADTAITIAQDVSELDDGQGKPLDLERTSVVDELLEPATGRPPARRYRVDKEIATGGMGRVVLAHDGDLSRPVAVKLNRSKSAHARRRFVEEVQLAGQLQHPNIVPIHDVGVGEDGTSWYTMRYVEGSTLADIITRLRRGDRVAHALYSPARRMSLFFNILDAVGYAHGRGIIHRDLKPGNILVGTYGEVFVTDWGIAKRRGAPADLDAPPADDDTREIAAGGGGKGAGGSAGSDSGGALTSDGDVIGTPAYMAPEQARGEHAAVDERSDVYALSAILFELLSLNHYLRLKASATREEVLREVREQVPWLASTARHPAQALGVPVDVARVLARGLAKDPALRFQSVAELRAALLRIEEGKPKVQCPSTAALWGLGALKRAMSRRPVLGWFLVAGFFVCAFYGAGSLVVQLLHAAG